MKTSMDVALSEPRYHGPVPRGTFKDLYGIVAPQSSTLYPLSFLFHSVAPSLVEVGASPSAGWKTRQFV